MLISFISPFKLDVLFGLKSFTWIISLIDSQEVAINEYFKPLDKEAEALVNMQFENEKAKAEMMAAMYKQAIYERAEVEAAVEVNKAKMIQQNLEAAPPIPKKLRWDEMELICQEECHGDKNVICRFYIVHLMTFLSAFFLPLFLSFVFLIRKQYMNWIWL